MFVSYNWIYSDKKLLKTYFHFRQTSPTEQKWELGGVHAFAGSRLVGVCKKNIFLQRNDIDRSRKEWIYLLGTYLGHK